MKKILLACGLLVAACSQSSSGNVDPSSLSRIDINRIKLPPFGQPCTLTPIEDSLWPSSGRFVGGWATNGALVAITSTGAPDGEGNYTFNIDGWEGKQEFNTTLGAEESSEPVGVQASSVSAYYQDILDGVPAGYTKPQSSSCSSLSGVIGTQQGVLSLIGGPWLPDGTGHVTPQFKFYLYGETLPNGTVVQDRLRAVSRDPSGNLVTDIMFDKAN